jgi:hypothetical protein
MGLKTSKEKPVENGHEEDGHPPMLYGNLPPNAPMMMGLPPNTAPVPVPMQSPPSLPPQKVILRKKQPEADIPEYISELESKRVKEPLQKKSMQKRETINKKPAKAETQTKTGVSSTKNNNNSVQQQPTTMATPEQKPKPDLGLSEQEINSYEAESSQQKKQKKHKKKEKKPKSEEEQEILIKEMHDISNVINKTLSGNK